MRNITLTFEDGSTHQYQNAPDEITPDEVMARASSDFPGMTLSNVDGGKASTNEPVFKALEVPAPTVGNIATGLLKNLSFQPVHDALKLAVHDAFNSDGGIEDKVRHDDLLRKATQAQDRIDATNPAFDSATAQGIYSGGASLVQSLPGLAASIATANPAPMLVMAGARQGLPAYAKYLDRGATKGEAALGATGEGAAEVGFEAWPMGFLVNKFGKAGAGEFLKGLLGREILTEQGTTFVQDAIDTAIANPDKTWGEYWKERPGAMYQTLLATLTQGGLTGGLSSATRAMAGRNEEKHYIGAQNSGNEPAQPEQQADEVTPEVAQNADYQPVINALNAVLTTNQPKNEAQVTNERTKQPDTTDAGNGSHAELDNAATVPSGIATRTDRRIDGINNTGEVNNDKTDKTQEKPIQTYVNAKSKKIQESENNKLFNAPENGSGNQFTDIYDQSFEQNKISSIGGQTIATPDIGVQNNQGSFVNGDVKTEAQTRLDYARNLALKNIEAGLTREDFSAVNAQKLWKYDDKSPYYHNIYLLRKDLIDSGYGNKGQLPKLFDEVLSNKTAQLRASETLNQQDQSVDANKITPKSVDDQNQENINDKQEQYHPAIKSFADDLVEGGGTVVMPDGRRSQSLNPSWFKDNAFVVLSKKGEPLAKSPSVKEIKQAVAAHEIGKTTDKQKRILSALSEVARAEEEFQNQGYHGAQLDFAREINASIINGNITVEELHNAETPEQFDALLSKAKTLTGKEAAAYLDEYFGENNGTDRQTEDGSVSDTQETAPEGTEPADREQQNGQRPGKDSPQFSRKSSEVTPIRPETTKKYDYTKHVEKKLAAVEQELRTNNLTGIPNHRAFTENNAPKFVAAIDVDSLKFINDSMGHGAGNDLLKVVARVLRNHVEAYHVSGDELLARGDSLEELTKGLEAAQRELQSGKYTIVSDNGYFNKPSFSYGIAETKQGNVDAAVKEADLKMLDHKNARERSGERAARGEAPQGFHVTKEGDARPNSALPIRPSLDTFSTPLEAQAHLVKQFGSGINRLVLAGILNFTNGKSSWPDSVKSGISSDAEAAYMNGKAYIDLQATDKAHLNGVVLHEIGEHYNLKAMIGEDAYNELQSRITNLAMEKGSKAEEVWRVVAKHYPDLNQGSEDFVSEVIAKLGQITPDAPWYKQLISKIKAFLMKRGFGRGFVAGTITEDDMHALLVASLRSAAARKNIKKSRSYDGHDAMASKASSAITKKDVSSLSSEETKPFKDLDFIAKIAPKSVPLLYHRDELGNIQFTAGERATSFIHAAMRPMLVKAGMAGAPVELKKMLTRQKAAVDKAMRLAGDVADTTKDMTEQEAALIGRMIVKEMHADDVPPEHAIQMAAVVEQAMTQQSKDLIDLKMLSESAHEKWAGRYLPRFYNRDLDPELNTVWRRMFKSKPVDGFRSGSLKGRGKSKVVTVAELPQWEALGWEVRDKGWSKNKQGQLELTEHGKQIPNTDMVAIWNDYTQAERKDMGEIEDFRLRFVMGYISMQKDIALGRLFKQIAENSEWTRTTASDGFVYVPETEIPDTGGLKRYGMLSGLYVRKDILDHISRFEQNDAEFIKYYKAALNKWKEGKTVLNPVSHMNNFVSNVSMAHFAGVSYWDGEKYLMALRDLVGNKGMVSEAEDAGLFANGMAYDEFMRGMPDNIRKMVDTTTDSPALKTGRFIWKLASLGLNDKAAKLYNLGDTFFKYAIYRDARNKGLSPDDAVQYALKYIFNYDDLPSTARAIRDYGIPFFGYTYKLIPALMDTALEYPWRFAAPASIVASVNALVYASLADDDDWWLKTAIDGSLNAILNAYSFGLYGDGEPITKGQKLEQSERENLPEWDRGRSAIGADKTLRLGVDERTGLPVYINIYRMTPGGDLYDTDNEKGGLGLPAPFTPNSPILGAYSALLDNKNWNGKDLVDDNDTPAEKSKKYADWAWKFAMPAIAPFGGHYDRLMDATANYFDKTIETPLKDYTGIGKDGLPVQPKYAIGQTVGIKARPVDLEQSAQISDSKDRGQIRDIQREMRRAVQMYNKGAMSEREKDQIIEESDEKISRINGN